MLAQQASTEIANNYWLEPVAMKPRFKTILWIVLAILLLSQLIPVDRAVPEVDPAQDFLTIVNAPPAMATLIKNACYDCHSYETEYPWYAKISPLSFWIQGQIRNGRKELNFSEWASYAKDKAQHKLEESFEEVDERHMPLKSYTWLHSAASMSDEQVVALALWFQQTYRSQQ